MRRRSAFNRRRPRHMRPFGWLGLGLCVGSCSPVPAKLPESAAFGPGGGSETGTMGDDTSSIDSGVATCSAETCAGCCSEDGTCVDVLTDQACARAGETCRDCTTDDRTCAPDAVCTNPAQLPSGETDDHAILLHDRAGALRTREDLRMRIFGTATLPELDPTSVDAMAADPFEVALELEDDVMVEQLTFDLPGGTSTPAWVLTPARPSGALVVVHQGHWHTLKEGNLPTVAHAALFEGAVVVGLPMPLYGGSAGPVPTHDDLIATFPADVPGHGAQVFLAPVAASIDYVRARHTIDHITMVGISGGGWTTLLYAALDPRIDRAISIAGGEPLYQRADLDWGDREQHDPWLYAVAGYPALAVLGALEPGRDHLQILHRYDTCCFAGTGYQDWEPAVQEVLSDFEGGQARVFLDESIRGHEVSDFALAAAIHPALAGDHVRYFDDTLPGYGAFTTTGTWERDASGGFGADSARGSDGTATWTVDLPAGAWSASLTWTPDPVLADAAPVDVSAGSLSDRVVVDQTGRPTDLSDANAHWTVIAEGHLDSPDRLTVTLHGSTDQPVRADALRVEAEWSP